MSPATRRGAVKVEYALILLLISVLCLLAVASLGRGVSGLFTGVIPPWVANQPPAATDDTDDTAGEDAAKDKKPKKNKAAKTPGQPGRGNPGNAKAVGNAGTR
jgi:hypothetical protein